MRTAHDGVTHLITTSRSKAFRRLLLLLLATLSLFHCDLFDILPPKIEIVEPKEGVSYFNTLPCSLRVTDNRKVAKVEVFLDGESIHEFTKGPYTTDISLARVGGRTAILKAVAYDKAGNYAEAERQIFTWVPILIGTYDTPGYAYGLFVSGGYAYVADKGSGLQIINVSNPASPTLAGSDNTPGNAYGLFVSGGYAYVADEGSGLQVINVSNPAGPTLAGSYNTPGSALGVYVSGSYAYVADRQGGLQVIDVANPASPIPAVSCDTPGDASGVFISGSYAYVTDYKSGLQSGLQVINVSNPASPTWVGSYATPSLAWGVFVSGSYAYVADRYSGLQIVNISNPASPILAGSCDTPDWAQCVFVSGSYAYVAALGVACRSLMCRACREAPTPSRPDGRDSPPSAREGPHGVSGVGGTAESSHEEKTINRQKTTQQRGETSPVWQPHSRTMRSIARQLRKRPTRSEHMLWQAIRKRQLGGLRFLRQHPIGPAVVDFYCHEKHLAVELDGGIHENRDVKEYDLARQDLIEMYGIRSYRSSP